MAIATATRGSSEEEYQKWKVGIDRANHDWNFYDATIRSIVQDYNRHLAGTPRFDDLDWRIVKAMLWTESGPHQKKAWATRPLQIGVPRDLGLGGLLDGKEGGDLIIPPSYHLGHVSVRNYPKDNLAAAVGYLFMRMADYGFATVPDKDVAMFDVTARQGDSLSTIARTCGSTIDTLRKLNPGANVVQPGQVLRCQKASIRKVIIGWKQFTYKTVARRYNGNGAPSGDPRYALEYAMTAIRSKGQ